MTLILNPQEVRGIISMNEAIEAVEIGFKNWGENELLNALRHRIFAPSGVRTSVHQGAVPGVGASGLLIHCERLNATADEQIQEGIAPPVGVLYDSENSSSLAVLIGAVTAKEVGGRSTSLRTAATSAVGTKLLARRDANSVGILGSGVQAKNHLVALTCIRPITKARVYSRNPKNREAFVEAMEKTVGFEIEVAESAEQAVRGCDILLCATNASIPVLDGNWLERGTHVISIVGSDIGLVKAGYGKTMRREVDDTTIRRADLIVVNSVEQIKRDQHADIYDTVSQGIKSWADIIELRDIVAGAQPGRTSEEQITLFKNNAGQGVADVAILAKVYVLAKAQELGIEIPTNLLSWTEEIR